MTSFVVIVFISILWWPTGTSDAQVLTMHDMATCEKLRDSFVDQVNFERENDIAAIAPVGLAKCEIVVSPGKEI